MSATLAAMLPLALLGVAVAPWFPWLAGRAGAGVAGATLLAGVGVLVLTGFTVGAVTATSPVLATAALALAVFVGGCVATARRRPEPRALRRPLVVGAAAGLPGLGWLVGVLVARTNPGADSLAWAMLGDGANNIQLARRMLAENGHALWSRDAAVPLQNELLAIAMWPGRTMTAGDGLLAHDMVALGAFWAVAIAVTGAWIGVAVAASLGRAPLPVAAGVAALTAATCLGWFVVGMPLEWGYLNVHVALPIVLAAWPAYLSSERHPRSAFAVCLALATIVLTSWSPLVVVPLALAAAMAWRHREAVRSAAPRAALPIAVVAVAAGVVFFAIYIPTFSHGLDSLRAIGNGYPFLGWLLAAVCLAALALGFVRGVPRARVLGLRALVVAAVAGLGVLAAIILPDTDVGDRYYPAKFTWLAIIAVGVPTLAEGMAALLRALRGRVAHATVLGLAAAVAVATLALPPVAVPGHAAALPLARLAAGQVWNTGDDAAAIMVALQRAPTAAVLWGSGNPDEAIINYWALDFRGSAASGGSRTARGVVAPAYRFFHDHGLTRAAPARDLCVLGTELPAITAYTADTALASAVAAECPDARVTVVVGPVPGT